MRIASIRVFPVTLPLRRELAHAAAVRRSTENVLVRVELGSGAVGWGEAVPRRYLTGESTESVLAALRHWTSALSTHRGGVESWLEQLRTVGAAADTERRTAAFCALELGCLDAIARHQGTSFGALVSLPPPPRRLDVALPILAADPCVASRIAWSFQGSVFSRVKVKVGMAGDVERLRAVRAAIGDRVELWVDANGAWSVEQAIASLRSFERFGVAAVEQPVAAADLRGLRQVQDATGVDVSADESVCTLEDAKRLLAVGSCRIWNVRIAKCGGVLRALELIRLANQHGLSTQLGCLVGETSVLAAAGVWLAGAGPFRCFEGAYGRLALREDPVSPSLTPATASGVLRRCRRGLGVEVVQQALAAHAGSGMVELGR